MGLRAFRLLGVLTLLALAQPARADDSFVIGIMNDQSGPYADIAGPSSVEAVRMAIEDFGGTVLGKKIELLVADHQNKVDVGLSIARQWYEERNVRTIFDITNSGVALALQSLAKSHDRLVIFDSASSSDLSGKNCSTNTMQWNADNWSNGVSLMRLLMKQKLDSFYFITADYAFGTSLEADARAAIAEGGGTTVGSVRAPLNTSDFSSFLLSAQASQAKVVVLANTGADLSTSLKQANEFGLTPTQYIAAPIMYLSDVNALGLAIAHDLTFMQSWYWDLNDATRAWSKRFFARTKRMPNDNQAVLYSSVRHYLEAVAKTGTDDALTVAKAMRDAPIHDVFTDDGHIREDGRVVYDRYLMKVKTPAESKYPWDYLTVVAKIPADQAFRPLGATGCKLGAH
ncbi:MAG TPA: ABC transporter substrate-binding protein [Roseiarcus sp.]|jgi:branched-chain amino acid transport system substrate-binding protein